MHLCICIICVYIRIHIRIHLCILLQACTQHPQISNQNHGKKNEVKMKYYIYIYM